jgi:hypothetical protein
MVLEARDLEFLIVLAVAMAIIWLIEFIKWIKKN